MTESHTLRTEYRLSACIYNLRKVDLRNVYLSGVGTHDMAAVQVIVEEAGGKITGQDGKELDYSKPFKGAIVSNGTVHQKLVEIVNC